MMYGLAQKEYQFLLEKVIMPLTTKSCQVYLYGSRARGEHHKFSDVDLMVHEAEDHRALIGNIQEEIQSSNFPYKVDLVLFEDFAESYKENYFKDRVPFGLA